MFDCSRTCLAVAAGVGLVSLTLALASSSSAFAQGSKPPTGVLVTNPFEQPVPIRDAGRIAKTPFQDSILLTMDGTTAIGRIPVPADKLLVIEFVSADMRIPESDRMVRRTRLDDGGLRQHHVPWLDQGATGWESLR